jgi:hypothetical protein
VPCISGNYIFVMYVITTTTTNTVMTAPFVAANGPINYVGGGVSYVGPASTSSSSTNGVTNNAAASPGTEASPGTGVWMRCVFAPSGFEATTMQLTCPISAAGAVTGARPAGRGLVKLACSLSLGARTAHIAHSRPAPRAEHSHTASAAGHGRKALATAHSHTASATAHIRTAKRKPARGVRAVRNVFVCRSM